MHSLYLCLKRKLVCGVEQGTQHFARNCDWKASDQEGESDQNLERILQSAIIVSWADLTRGSKPCLIHVEFGLAPSGTLDYLQVWSSVTRGYWLLASTY